MTWQVVKIIAIVSMTLDHAATAFLTQPFLIDRLGMGMVASARILGIMHILGRILFRSTLSAWLKAVHTPKAVKSSCSGS